MVICKTNGCNINASYGLENKKISCKTHSSADMVHLVKTKQYKCKCNTVIPIFGLPGDKSPSCCKNCRTSEMIDLKHKKCKCNKSPSFGYISDKIISCCKNCKTPEMVDLKHKKTTPTIVKPAVNRKCKCNKVPVFGLVTDERPTCCKNCRTPEMIDLKNKKCKCGKARPSFGVEEDNKAICCKECRTDKMISISRNNKCKCGKNSYFGLITDKTPTCCYDCKNDNMTNIRDKKCKFDNCDTQISNKCYKGYCAYHYGNLYPDSPIIRNFKTKERKVVDYVREKYPDFTWKFDKIVKDGCSSRRPDIFLDLGYQILIIEIDEFQHKQYDKTCDNSRIMEISKDVGHRPIVFIRFNPDKYIDKNNKYIASCFSVTKETGLLKIADDKKWIERLEKLKSNVNYYIENKSKKIINIIELYYDGF